MSDNENTSYQDENDSASKMQQKQWTAPKIVPLSTSATEAKPTPTPIETGAFSGPS